MKKILALLIFVSGYCYGQDTIRVKIKGGIGGAAAAASRFGIEDNLGIQNRNVDMQTNNFQILNFSSHTIGDFPSGIYGDATFSYVSLGQIATQLTQSYNVSNNKGSLVNKYISQDPNTTQDYTNMQVVGLNNDFAKYINWTLIYKDDPSKSPTQVQTTKSVQFNSYTASQTMAATAAGGTYNIGKSDATHSLNLEFPPNISAHAIGTFKTMPVSVNGTYADSTGNITIAAGGGGGVSSLSSIGSTPNANAGTITGSVLNFQPANESFGGMMTILSQSFGGNKTFADSLSILAALNKYAALLVKADFPYASSVELYSPNSPNYSHWIMSNRIVGAGMGFYNVDYALTRLYMGADGEVRIGGNATNAGTLAATTTGQVGIGTANNGSADITVSAKFEVRSTTQGSIPATRMTTTQRTDIPSPAEGLQVYDLTLHKLYVFDGTVWQAAW